MDNPVPNEHHCTVHHFGITLTFDAPVFVDVAKSHQHLPARDSHLVEAGPALIQAVEAKLDAKVSRLNTCQPFEGAEVSQLHKEWMYSDRFPINQCFAHYHSVCRYAPYLARPELRALDIGRVNHPLIRVEVQRSGRLDLGDVTAVTQLCLSIATKNFVVGDPCLPFIFLVFIRTNIKDTVE